MKLSRLISLCTILLLALPIFSQKVSTYSEAGYQICETYKRNAYKLSPSKAGHMGLRLYRNYEDDSYAYLLLQGINRYANSLNKLVEIGLDEELLELYAEKINKSYSATTEKKSLRKASFESFPMYRIYATRILRNLARLDELGLRHNHHKEFMTLLKQYDFKSVFTDEMMIRAWGAQLANQVYWLHQLGIADYRAEFVASVQRTYPNEEDSLLSDQQFGNKIYTLTHIIIAASEYYRYPVDYDSYASVIDYFRTNTKQILLRCKEDIIIEVGLSLLLVNEAYEEINTIRDHILKQIDAEAQMVPSVSGSKDLALGEHRNIIAVLLLDWGGTSITPNQSDIKKFKSNLNSELWLVKQKQNYN